MEGGREEELCVLYQGLALCQVDRISRCQLIKQPYLHPSAGPLRAKQKAWDPRAGAGLLPDACRGPGARLKPMVLVYLVSPSVGADMMVYLRPLRFLNRPHFGRVS